MWLLAIFVVLLSVLLFFRYVDRPKGFIDEARYKTWHNALIYYKQHWVFGYGIGHWKTFGNTYAEKYNFKWMNKAHNDVIQGLFEMGPLFIILLVGFWISSIRAFNKKYSDAVLICFTAFIIIFLNCLVNFLFQISTLSVIAVTWVSLMLISCKGES